MTANNIPKHWRIKKLGEVCNICDNLRRPINSSERQKRIAGKKEIDLFPYYGATGQVGWIDSFITDSEYILVGEDGAPFLDLFKDKAYKIKGRTWVNNHAHILEGRENIILNDFALYYLNSINYRKFVNGTTRLKLTKSNLVEIPFVVPPLSEQQAIVFKIEELLSDLENGKHQLQLAQQQLKVYRQSLLKWAFEGKLTAARTGRDLSQKDGELPKGWKLVSLGEICSPQRKCSYGVLVPGDHVENGILLLRVGDIDVCGRIDQTKMKKISPTIANKYKRTFLEGGEVVMSLVGAIGRTAVVPATLKGANIARAVGVIPVSKNISAKFVELMLRSPKKIKEHNDRSHEVARKTLNLEDVIKSKIPLPSYLEQLNIVTELESKLTVCDKIEETINQSLQQAETLRQSILKKAFEGKLI